MSSSASDSASDDEKPIRRDRSRSASRASSASAASGEAAPSGEEISLPGGGSIPADTKTLMIKNLPCRVTEEEILEAAEDLGFGGAHNYFHLPVKKTAKAKAKPQTSGYCFFGFETSETAVRFAKAMSGFQFKKRQSDKLVMVTTAHIDGQDPRAKETGAKRKRKAAAAEASPQEKTGGQAREPKGEPQRKKQKTGHTRPRIPLDAPLTASELSQLDERGSSRPCWLAREPLPSAHYMHGPPSAAYAHLPPAPGLYALPGAASSMSHWSGHHR
eukprot:TRINITY_DN91686_c0_g1_i1.p1 TRINITY_DN91686_c0_g1~~TRINITY_DN91686_c0_g1_i1.p1  ORF type:complete len:273 (-),score=46.23 TRINITY_DN91686_c0_g1_i1:43-861(-)